MNLETYTIVLEHSVNPDLSYAGVQISVFYDGGTVRAKNWMRTTFTTRLGREITVEIDNPVLTLEEGVLIKSGGNFEMKRTVIGGDIQLRTTTSVCIDGGVIAGELLVSPTDDGLQSGSIEIKDSIVEAGVRVIPNYAMRINNATLRAGCTIDTSYIGTNNEVEAGSTVTQTLPDMPARHIHDQLMIDAALALG